MAVGGLCLVDNLQVPERRLSTITAISDKLN